MTEGLRHPHPMGDKAIIHIGVEPIGVAKLKGVVEGYEKLNGDVTTPTYGSVAYVTCASGLGRIGESRSFTAINSSQVQVLMRGGNEISLTGNIDPDSDPIAMADDSSRQQALYGAQAMASEVCKACTIWTTTGCSGPDPQS